MANDLTATQTLTSGRFRLAPVDALTRFAAVKLSGAALAVQSLSDLRYGVKVANMGLLVPAGVICEVVDGLTVHPLPNAAGWFPGMLNLRGNLIPVFDLHALCSGSPADLGKLLVVDRGERAAAIPIDQLPVPVDPRTASEHQPPISEELRPYLRGGFIDDGELWVELDFTALFESLGMRAGN
jgi:twitching motility protein PilI